MVARQESKTQPTAAVEVAPGRTSATGNLTSTPIKAASVEQSAVMNLLRVEGEARAAASLPELALFMANETGKIVRTRQTLVFKTSIVGAMQLEAASSLTEVDRQVPLFQAFERLLVRLAKDAGLQQAREFAISAYIDAADGEHSLQAYPHREALWFPLADRRGEVFAGMLLLRDDSWTSNEVLLTKRLSACYAHAWYWIATQRSVALLPKISRRHALFAAVAVLAVGLFPVSLTALAPLEVAPRDPLLVAAPIDGVIEDIPVAPNSAVAVGDVLLRFADTTLRNRYEVAEREATVADQRVKKTTLLAVGDIRSRHELALDTAEFKVKIAERDYARELLARTVVKATRPGRVIFGDKRDLIGKPTSTGERIMEVADPAHVEIRIDVATSDSIILSDGKRVKLFLDSDPLNARSATVRRTDYQAKPTEAGTLAFRVIAQIDEDGQPPPRLGIRGTAQLYGERVPFAYYLLRRPIASLRQWIGL